MLGPAWTNRHRAAARARRNRRRDRRQPFRLSLAGHCLCCRTPRLFATAKVIARARNGIHAETDCLTIDITLWPLRAGSGVMVGGPEPLCRSGELQARSGAIGVAIFLQLMLRNLPTYQNYILTNLFRYLAISGSRNG